MTEQSQLLDINKIITSLVEKNFERVFTRVKKEVKDKFTKTKIDFNFAFKTYLEKAYSKYSRIKTLIYRTEPKYIYDFFECNDLRFNGQKFSAQSADVILEISKFLIIQGSGGIGKSTLMKHIFVDTLLHGQLIPVFVELRDINDFKGSLFEFIHNSMSKLGFNYDEEYFKYAMEEGCFLFLLDGYDEVLSSKSTELFRQIDELCDRYEDNYYCISSRPVESFIAFQRFCVLKSQPLNKLQAISLVNKIDYDKDVKAKFLSKLDSEL